MTDVTTFAAAVLTGLVAGPFTIVALSVWVFATDFRARIKPDVGRLGRIRLQATLMPRYIWDEFDWSEAPPIFAKAASIGALVFAVGCLTLVGALEVFL